MAVQFTYANVIAEWISVTKRDARLITIAVLLISGLNVLLDLIDHQHPANGILSLVVSVYGQYYVVAKMLDDGASKIYAGKPRYGALFVAGLLGGLGILVGTALLLVPGLILASRWSVSTPFVVAEGLGGSAALKASWNSTSGSRMTVLLVQLALLGVTGALLLGIVAVGALAHLDFNAGIVPLTITVLFSLATVAEWILGVAIYRCIQPALAGLVDTFA